MLRLFGLIGVFVLLLACINFMNLSTARSEKRAKEVGIRKTIGSLRRQLIWQFFSESLLVALLAFVLALGLFLLSLPFFNELAESKMTIPWSNPLWWIALYRFQFVHGTDRRQLSGSLSFFLPTRQSAERHFRRQAGWPPLPRKILVVIAVYGFHRNDYRNTIIVFRQVQYAKDRPVGYDQRGIGDDADAYQ